MIKLIKNILLFLTLSIGIALISSAVDNVINYTSLLIGLFDIMCYVIGSNLDY